MLVDGRNIAKDILTSVETEVASFSRPLTMTAVTCAPNFETKKYLEMKKRKAAAVGIALNVVELPEEATTTEAVSCVRRVAEDSEGVVVQLPLPQHMDRDVVLTAVPHGKDPDGFGYDGSNEECLPPVVGAIDEITHRHSIEWRGKQVVVLGHGRLVGMPAALYAKVKGGDVTVLTEDNFAAEAIAKADIIVTGIGHPRFVTSDMVKEGVAIFDAGTSEDGGVLVGDVDPVVAEKASVFTPVPGGIGPITIAYLLKNLVTIARQ